MGKDARVLLTSVFGPYARDDAYGSRAINPMELYHNQVTRTQGVFFLRMFHRSWGLMLIQANIDAPCTLLDFPSLDRFDEELKTARYDVVGIGAILPNVGKVAKMCALVREHQPQAAIVVGGHVANHPHIRDGEETEFLLRAFRRDFEVNGASVLRIARTLLRGRQRHKNDPDPRVRERYRRECRDLPTAYAGALWAAQRWLRGNPPLVLLAAMHREGRRLRRGRTYEPPTFYETNRPHAAGERAASPCRWVVPVAGNRDPQPASAGVGGARPVTAQG